MNDNNIIHKNGAIIDMAPRIIIVYPEINNVFFIDIIVSV